MDAVTKDLSSKEVLKQQFERTFSQIVRFLESLDMPGAEHGYLLNQTPTFFGYEIEQFLFIFSFFRSVLKSICSV